METKDALPFSPCPQSTIGERRRSYDERSMNTTARSRGGKRWSDHGSLPPLPTCALSQRRSRGPPVWILFQLVFISIFLLARSTHAAFISTFDNCLSPNTINSNPQQLQITPYWVWALFNASASSHNLNITVYGNVTGIATQQPYPPINDPQWTNPNETVGKIVDVSKATNLATTLEAQFNVLDYTPYNAPATRFCNTTIQGNCPLAPNFAPNA